MWPRGYLVYFDRFSNYFGIILGLFWEHSGIILGSFWYHLETIPCVFWDFFGIILVLVGDSFLIILKIILVSLWDHFSIILKSFWEHVGTILQRIGDHFGNILGSLNGHKARNSKINVREIWKKASIVGYLRLGWGWGVVVGMGGEDGGRWGGGRRRPRCPGQAPHPLWIKRATLVINWVMSLINPVTLLRFQGIKVLKY